MNEAFVRHCVKRLCDRRAFLRWLRILACAFLHGILLIMQGSATYILYMEDVVGVDERTTLSFKGLILSTFII